MKTPDFQFLRTEPVALKRYLPVFLYLSQEFKAIQDALGKEHERQRQAQIDVAKQFHAETATWGMASWERMLGINVDTSVDLETRRASVLSKMGKPPTVTPAFLTRMINLFTTVAATQIVEHPSEYTVDIYLPDSGTHDFTKIDEAVNTYLPAHLGHTYHFKTHLDASEYIGTVIRMASRGVECGLLANDEVLQTAVLWSVDTPVFEIKDDAVHVTELGLKMNSVFSASTKEVTPCSSAPIGATDGIFYVSGDGSVKQKLGSPATFTRASAAVLGGRTYQVNEPRFMDNGLLCEPTTTNLAASVIDVTNGSLDYWLNYVGSGTFELSSKETYNHSNSIHLKDGASLKLVEFDIKSTFNTIYTFSCMAFVVSGKCYLRLEEGGAPWPGLSSQPTSETGKWIKLSVTYKTTVKDKLLHCRIYVGEGDDVYIDDIQLEVRPYATSFTPTSRDAAERLTIAEWVVNKPQWTCEFDLSVNDKQVNYERPVDFWIRGERSFRAEMAKNFCMIKGAAKLDQISKSTNAMTTPHRLAITWDQGAVGYYFDGEFVGTATETSGEKVLSSIWMGDCVYDPFNGCFKNFRFSSTVHTAEKIAADSKLDELPVEDDTVLYMPLKEDLSMYGHYND
ncbi:putative phage tail protein [Acidaminococcus fermentans]|uniref:putative phage tail protein n=1 Tax=Acidaminococcus fermentans TaxID=905 RepID=UPI003F8BA70A